MVTIQPSSIEHGGTSAIYIFMAPLTLFNEAPKRCSAGPQECIFMAQLALFNEGVRDHFPICGNFGEVYVLLVAGEEGLYCFPCI